MKIALTIWTVLASGAPDTYGVLRTQCLLHAADPKNPWGLAHGVTALGPRFVAQDGRLAKDVLIEDFLRQSTHSNTGRFSFERYAKDGTPIEPHTNLLIKTLVLAPLPPSSQFSSPFGKISVGDLVASVQKGFVHSPSVEAYWKDVGWTLDLLAATLKPGKTAVFKNGLGQIVDFNAVMEDALSYLERIQSDLEEGMKQGLPQVTKKKQGIYGHPCGGLHLVQAVYSWARHAAVRTQWGERLHRQRALLFYRLESESRQYDEAEQKAPAYRLQILAQKLKFYGHFLETLGRMKDEMGYRPSKQDKQSLRKAQSLLDATVGELAKQGIFDSMDTLRTSQRQIYLDLIGDSCHAVHGLNYWR